MNYKTGKKGPALHSPWRRSNIQQGCMLSLDPPPHKLLDYVQIMNNSQARVPHNDLFRKISSSPLQKRKKEQTYITSMDNIFVYNPIPIGEHYLFLPPRVMNELESNEALCRNVIGEKEKVNCKQDYESELFPFRIRMHEPKMRQKLSTLMRFYCRSPRYDDSPRPSKHLQQDKDTKVVQDTKLKEGEQQIKQRTIKKKRTFKKVVTHKLQ